MIISIDAEKAFDKILGRFGRMALKHAPKGPTELVHLGSRPTVTSAMGSLYEQKTNSLY